MKNKSYLVKKLMALRNLTDPESSTVKEMYDMKVLDLMIAIKNETPVPVPVNKEEEYLTLAEMVGCSRDRE